MKQGIPEQIKLFKFASRGLSFSKKYKIRDLPRVSELVSNLDDFVNVELSFMLVTNNVPCIIGEIKLNVDVPCQRCLNDVNICLMPKFKLAFLQNEQQGEELDSSYDTVLNNDEKFSTIEFITDEVLISMPMIPMHKHECTISQDSTHFEKQKRESPFAILKQTKINKQE